MDYKITGPLTPEVFSEICEGMFTPKQVTPAMIKIAQTVLQSEANRLLRKDGVLAIGLDEMCLDPTIIQIEEEITGCRDRHIVAVLKVAKVYGDDGWNDRLDNF